MSKAPTPEVVAAMIADYQRGVPVNTISTRHGWSPNTIRTYARAAGLGPRLDKGVCSSCSATRILGSEGLCGTCVEEIPLTEGRWVRRGLVHFWVADPTPAPMPKPEPAGMAPMPELPVEGAPIACPTCQATVYETCRSSNGIRQRDHAARVLPRVCPCGGEVGRGERICSGCRRENQRRWKKAWQDRQKAAREECAA